MTDKTDKVGDDDGFDDSDEQTNDDYEVGYKKPPKHSRYKPGQSGNPKGRPKRTTKTLPMFSMLLDELVPVKMGANGSVLMSVKQAFLRNIIGKANSSKSKELTIFYDLLKRTGELDPAEDPGQRSGVIVVPPKMSMEEWIEKYGKPPPEEDEGNNHGED